MRIQHNIMAMNAYRNFSNNTSALSKNLEKLSSGYKINRAGDDAAGLAISEKMRAQITGLKQAQDNAKSGINLVQTAEGAMQEVHDMLNRMVKLADQSANGTYDNETDRAQLQKEVDQLKSEIDRIADSANFNGIKLMDGSLNAPSGATLVKAGWADAAVSAITETAGATFTQDLTITSGVADAKEGTNGTMELAYLDKDGTARSATISFKYGKDANTTAANVSNALKDIFGEGYNVSVSGAAITIKNSNGAEEDKTQILSATQFDDKGNEITNAPTVGNVTAGTDTTFTLGIGGADAAKKNVFEIDGQKFQLLKRGETAEAGHKAIYTDSGTATSAEELKNVAQQLNNYGVKAKVNAAGDDIEIVKSNGNDGKGGLTLQIGDTSDAFNQITVGIQDMHVQSLGLSSVDVSTQKGAAAAVDVIKDAINQVSDVRGTLGATQNRLDHTINNLSVMEENIQDAESTIRDTDVAAEMMAYTKNNILIQSAQAMLAQANQVPQGVLQLLQ